jgi:hypothetical protein
MRLKVVPKMGDDYRFMHSCPRSGSHGLDEETQVPAQGRNVCTLQRVTEHVPSTLVGMMAWQHRKPLFCDSPFLLCERRDVFVATKFNELLPEERP